MSPVASAFQKLAVGTAFCGLLDRLQPLVELTGLYRTDVGFDHRKTSAASGQGCAILLLPAFVGEGGEHEALSDSKREFDRVHGFS